MTLTILNVRLTNNAAGNDGGALLNWGTASITDSEISGNTAGFAGGGINNRGGLTVIRTTISNNTAERGGGIFLDTPAGIGMELSDSTISENEATFTSGGGINMHGVGFATITRAVITGNESGGSGSGIFVQDDNMADAFQPTMTISFSRIAGNEPRPPNQRSGIEVGSSALSALVTANDNWWGCNGGPDASGCDTRRAEKVNVTTWLQLRGGASPTTVAPGGAATLTADIFGRNSGAPLTAGDLTGLPSFPVTFDTASNGSLSAASPMTGGQATATFTASAFGPASARVAVDNQSITIDLTANTDPSSHASTSQTKAYVEDEPSVALDDIVVTDPDVGDTITARLTLNDTAAGSLSATTAVDSYTPGTGVWEASGSVTDVNAALAAVAFVPAPGMSLDTSVSVLIFDGLHAIEVTGTITLDGSAVNDPPQGADKTVTVNEDTAYTFTTADFGFSDPHDSPSNVLLAVKIVALPGAGGLANGGVGVTANQFITVADITANKLTFTPGSNGNGSPYTTFTFQVQDDGGIANAGLDVDPTPRIITVNVSAVADAPTATNLTRTTTYLEDAASVALDDIVVTELDAGDTISATLTLLHPNRGSLNGAGGTYNPANGVWTVSGTVGQVNMALAAVVFVPVANNDQDTAIRTLIRDVANTGPAEGTITLDVTPVNDQPTNVSLNGTMVAERSPNGTVVGTLSATDPDTGDTSTFTLTDSAGGRFGVNGTQLVVANDSLLGFETSPTHQVVVRATDTGGLSLERPFTIMVTNVVDTPTARPETYQAAAQTVLTVPAPGVLGNNVDPQNRPLTTVKVTEPQHGSLTLNANGSFTYTPASGFIGPDSFTYRASNGDEQSAPTTVSMVVQPVLSVADVQIGEGNAGDRTARLTVALSLASS